MRLFFSFLWIALAGASLFAQSSNMEPDQWQQLKALPQGQHVRVSLRAGGSYQGRLRDVTDETLTIGHSRILNKADIQRVWAKLPGHRSRHTLIGAAIGAGAGLGFGAAVDNDCSMNSLFCTGNRGKAIGAPLFAVIGAGIGAVLPAHRWQEVYSKP